MNIFKEQKLYPDEENSILSSFAGFYDCVFIAFLPFFRLKDKSLKKASVQKSHQISLEEFKAKDKLFANLPDFNANVYSYENDEYPEDEKIFENAETVSWKEIKTGASFNDCSEICKALKTSIGSYRKVFERVDLLKKLNEFTEKEQIFHPSDGNFEVLSKIEIYKALKSLGKNKIIIVDEFYESEKELNLNSIGVKEFVKKVEYKDYYIYPKDKSILFTIEWDSFFYLICSDKKNIDEILKNSNIEGFFCESETKHMWEWSAEELKKLLESEVQTEEQSIWTKVKNFLIYK
jgi:hypothetical protein